MPSAPFRNGLLSALTPADRELFRPCLELVELSAGQALAGCHSPPPYGYFLESGLAATVLSSERGQAVEVGLIGREGFVGTPIILHVRQCPRATTVLVSGQAYRIPAESLLGLTEASPGIRSRLLNFVHVFGIQISSTALAHARLQIERKLARWLLMAQDRLGDDLAVGHDFFAAVLGVRRPGVTTALHILEGEHLIRSQRKQITILNRQGLQAFAGPSYGIAEAEYRRIFDKPAQSAQAA